MSRKFKLPVKSLPEMKSAQKLRAKKSAKTTEPVEHFKRYSNNLALLMRDYDWSPVAELAEDLAKAIKSRAQLFICGNGGSAGNATHLANDFLYGVAKHPGAALRVISLSANPAVPQQSSVSSSAG